MFKFSRRILTLAMPAVALALASCGQPPELRVEDAKVILSPVDSNPSALYFTVYGGTQDVVLYSVISRSVIRSEIHETKVDPKTGMISMEATRHVPVPARGKVEFKRGGRHVMLWGVNRPARELEELEAEFIFSNGDRVIVDAPVVKASAAQEDHSKH